MKRFYPNGKLDGDDTETTEIVLRNLKCLKIHKPSQDLSYSDSILMLELIGVGSYYYYDNIKSSKSKVRDLASCSIPIHGRLKDDCELKTNEYMRRNGISNQKTISCSPEELVRKINPCLSDFKYSNHELISGSIKITEPGVIETLKDYKKYDRNTIIQSSGYKEREQLSLNQIWEFCIYKVGDFTEEYEEYNHTKLTIFGNTKKQHIDSDGSINEYSATEFSLRIKDGCRVELEKFLESCFKSK